MLYWRLINPLPARSPCSVTGSEVESPNGYHLTDAIRMCYAVSTLITTDGTTNETSNRLKTYYLP